MSPVLIGQTATESHVLAHDIFRIESLESTLQEKEKQLSEEREKFQKLKEDFKYNLRLLGERDQELDRYDTTFAGKILDSPTWPCDSFLT